MNDSKPEVFEFEKTFTLRPELAEVFYNIKRIDGIVDEVDITKLNEADIRKRFATVRGCLAFIYSQVDEVANDVFGIDLLSLSSKVCGKKVMDTINDIMDSAELDDNDPLPSDVAERFEKINVLNSRLEKAVSNFDEDAGLFESGQLKL